MVKDKEGEVSRSVTQPHRPEVQKTNRQYATTNIRRFAIPRCPKEEEGDRNSSNHVLSVMSYLMA